MREIVIEEQSDRLVLHTVELDGYINLPLTDGKVDTSRLEDNSCQKTFACSAKELRELITCKGY